MNVKNTIIQIMKPINVPLTRFFLSRHYRSNKVLTTNDHAERVLILAPHMDDETIGPGGTIRKHYKSGSEVHCVFITDGSNSVSDLSKDELIEARKEEITIVKDILGIAKVHYMSLPDGHVVSDEASQNILIKIIEEVKPNLIYSPLLVDAHSDHTATAEILADSIKRMNYKNCLVRLYEVNCAIPPEYINCVIDISDTIDDKREAIDKFISQAIAFDGFLALNKFKTNLVKELNLRAVEAFLELSGQDLILHKDKVLNSTYNFQELFKQINRVDTLLWAVFQNYQTKKRIYKETLKS